MEVEIQNCKKVPKKGGLDQCWHIENELMIDLLNTAVVYVFAAMLYASVLFWCLCLQMVGDLYVYVRERGPAFLRLLEDELEIFVFPPEESPSPYTNMAASGESLSYLFPVSQSTTYCRSDHSVPPDFLSGNNVHFLQRTSYEEPVEEPVVYRRVSSIIHDVPQDAGILPSAIEASVDFDSDRQVANEWDDPMDVDEVDPRCEPMDVDPWNWNLDQTCGSGQFNFEFVLPYTTNFASSGVAFGGASRVVDSEPKFTFVTAFPVGEGARAVPVEASASDTRRVLPEVPQRVASVASDDELGREIEDILAEILDDSD
ncbi:hypothetical protein K501DRAFT_269681 [Backusella circina FSU 941]|nr:hypothetical protein K501DRAFT_269681 [Backusella circina FSU 941]